MIYFNCFVQNTHGSSHPYLLISVYQYVYLHSETKKTCDGRQHHADDINISDLTCIPLKLTCKNSEKRIYYCIMSLTCMWEDRIILKNH